MEKPGSDDRSGRPGLWLAVTAAVLVVAMGGLVWWAVARSSRAQTTATGPGFEQYRSAWESAMGKAGVEASYPGRPIDIEELRTSGLRPFSATFTAEEIGALMNVYPYGARIAGRDVVLTDVVVAFPRAGVASASAKLLTDGTPYSVEVTLPLERTAKGINSTGPAVLKAEGFSVKGEQKQQAITALVGYLNLYVLAAPGLIVESAEIVEGGLVVSGRAPQSLEHPDTAAEPAAPAP